MKRKATAVVTLLTLAYLSDRAMADQTVKIGNVAALTGAIAHQGKDSENGARLAIEEINANGLIIGGEKITLLLDAQDDAADPRLATQVAAKLVDDRVVAVVGHTNSGTSIPASKIYSDAGITQITPSATNPTYTLQGFKTTFRDLATDAQQGPALASYAASSLHIKEVAIVDDATAYGQGLANEFERTARSLGMTVLSRDATNDKAVDFRAILTKIKGEHPDAIMYGGEDATGGPFAKQAKQLGLRGKVLAGDGACTEKLSDLAGDAVENVICTEAGTALEKMPGGPKFKRKYEKRYNQAMQTYAPYAYDAVYVIVDAMKRAGSVDKAKILAAMPSTNYRGVLGTIQFDEHGDIRNGVISVFQYKDGKKSLIQIIGSKS